MISTDVLLHGKNNWNFTSQKMKITDTNPFTRTQANPALQTTPEQYPALGVLLSTHREDLRAEIQQDYSRVPDELEKSCLSILHSPGVFTAEGRSKGNTRSVCSSPAATSLLRIQNRGVQGDKELL